MNEQERADWAARVRNSRVTIGWSKEEAARRAGISSITWKRVEDGLPVQDAKFERVLAAIKEMQYGTTPLRDVGRAPGSWPFGVSKDSPAEIATAVRLLEGQLDLALAEEQHAQVAMQNAHGRVEHLLGQIAALRGRHDELTQTEGEGNVRSPIKTVGVEAGSNQHVVRFPTSTDDLDPAEFPAADLAAAARSGFVEPGDQGDPPSDDEQAP